MPSPIGHALAGLAVGFVAEPTSGPLPKPAHSPFSTFALVGAFVAALPDADLAYSPIHRGVSHSLGATVFLMIVAMGVTGWVTGRIQWRWVLLVGAAHGSHILLDWLGTDHYPPPGIEALWPFSRTFYISGFDLFPPTERRLYLPEAWMINATAVLTEVGTMGPLAVLSWLATRRRRSRGRTSGPGDLRRPSA